MKFFEATRRMKIIATYLNNNNRSRPRIIHFFRHQVRPRCQYGINERIQTEEETKENKLGTHIIETANQSCECTNHVSTLHRGREIGKCIGSDRSGRGKNYFLSAAKFYLLLAKNRELTLCITQTLFAKKKRLCF